MKVRSQWPTRPLNILTNLSLILSKKGILRLPIAYETKVPKKLILWPARDFLRVVAKVGCERFKGHKRSII